jgi:hypothetical protein
MACYKTAYFEYLLSILNGLEGSTLSPRTHLDSLLLGELLNLSEDERRIIARNVKVKAATKSTSSSEVKNIARTLIKIPAIQKIPSLVLSAGTSFFCDLLVCFFIAENLYPQHHKNQ